LGNKKFNILGPVFNYYI